LCVPNILNIIFCVKGLWIENILTNNANAFRISHKLFLKPTENSKPARECICIHGIHGSYIKVAFQRRKSECGLLGATVFVSLGTGSWNLWKLWLLRLQAKRLPAMQNFSIFLAASTNVIYFAAHTDSQVQIQMPDTRYNAVPSAIVQHN